MIINNSYKNVKNKSKKFINVILILFIFSYLHILDNFKYHSLNKEIIKIKEFEKSYSKSFIDNFFLENNIYEISKFREINIKDTLIDHNIYQKNENPDVSVIITVFNQANCFYKALRSVQNQSLKNIEIIIIDDCSLDNTTEVIEKYMIEDKRIIYLKNKRNNGKIKSRSDAVRIAKGKYITIVDGDDAFCHRNVLYNSLSISNMADLDVVEFRYGFFEKKKLIQLNFNLNNIRNLNNRIIYQPELKFKFIDLVEGDSVNGFSNRCIWGKLIKNEIFKKVIAFIGKKYTEDYLLDYEDTLMTVSLFHVANSYYYMQELGYYKSKRECENPFPILSYKKCERKNFFVNSELDSIKYLNFLLDISKNTEIENKLIYKELMALDHFKKLNRKINKNFSYVYYIIKRINDSNFYTRKQKKRINKIYDKLVKKEMSIKNNYYL